MNHVLVSHASSHCGKGCGSGRRSEKSGRKEYSIETSLAFCRQQFDNAYCCGRFDTNAAFVTDCLIALSGVL